MAPKNRNRKRGTATALVAVSIFGGIQARPAFAQTTAAAEDRGVRRYDIPAGSLETVLAAYQAASGVTVTFAADLVRGITSPGVSGMFTAEQALKQLLEGSSLTFRFTAPFAATVEIRIANESVEVSAPTRAASPKYTEPLRNTPQTITVIPAGADGGAGGDDAARRAAQRVRASPSRPEKAARRPATRWRFAASARAPTSSSTASATSAATRAIASTSSRSR